ncbi:MAG: hypothetical protein HQM16_04175 [Deltaproteobacteria bacterium]|nr:hypothetical protein [Deltaproteobacteria bacterium]
MMNTFSDRKKLLLIVLLNMILTFPGLWVPFYNIDELTNTLFARFINNGDLSLKDFLGNTYLFTHYLYALVYQFVDTNTMLPMHIVHAIWKCLTILACYWAGKKLEDSHCGLWCALFYCVYSTCFMSKDFHTPSAESFSLLPAMLCAGCVFAAIDKGNILVPRNFKLDRARGHLSHDEGTLPRLNQASHLFYFIAGVFIAIAAFFKAPMGVVLVAACMMLIVRGELFSKKFLALNLGFLLIFVLPPLFVSPFGDGLRLMLEKINETNAVYIQFHEDVSFIYWFFKFLIRTLMVLGACFCLSLFAVYALRMVFVFSEKRKLQWQKFFFIIVWLILIWFAVAIGKRVFYHYYVFLLAPLSLLAGAGINHFDTRWGVFCRSGDPDPEMQPQAGYSRHLFLGFVRRHLVFFMVLSAVIFFIEGAFNISTMPGNFNKTIRYIRENTRETDHIYVWGNIPQLYFYSERQPSTVYFWSDVLAGTSPGSPAMEYVRATNKQLRLKELLSKDFVAGAVEKEKQADDAVNPNMAAINETELFTVEELVERIDHDYWRKVFKDFLHNPPELFIDSSPANIRGFGYFSIHKYELLKRFVLDNYKLETVIDGLLIYRLQGDFL